MLSGQAKLPNVMKNLTFSVELDNVGNCNIISMLKIGYWDPEYP